MKIHMNANIMKIFFFYKMKFDLTSYRRSHKHLLAQPFHKRSLRMKEANKYSHSFFRFPKVCSSVHSLHYFYKILDTSELSSHGFRDEKKGFD